MRAMLILPLASLLLATTLYPQSTSAADPAFTLTLSRGWRRGEFPRNTQTLIVRLTNTSTDWIRESGCIAGGLYKLSVLYNGVPQEEPPAIRKRREENEARESSGDCPGSNPGRRIQPGEYWEDPIYYQTDKPGTYEFVVEERDFTVPSQADVVKSNTLTIVVSPAEAQSVPPK